MKFEIPRWLGLTLSAITGVLIAGVFALACTFVYLAPSLPTAESMHRVELQVPLRVYASAGGLISQIGEQRRIPITYEDLPEIVRQAVLAAEDDRFFEHSGVDWMGVLRATAVNVASAEAGQGGSTITQQAARNMFLTLDKTLRRKLSEIFLTYRMERDFTKEQILATYLNVIFFGQRSYGIAAAAETFFGKRLADVNVAEAATLAGIIQLPSRYNPVSNPEAAKNRRSYVLRRMEQLGYIDKATAEAANREPIASRGFAPLYDVEAPYVAELARQEVVRRYGTAAVNAGYRVFTTIDGRLQTAANRALRIGLIEYDRRHGWRGALEKIKVGADSDPAALNALLEDRPAVSLLQPAIVLKVADTSADVHIKGQGTAHINWDGMSWAARQLRSGGVGARPRKAADVLAVGDVVYVISDQRGNAQLGQLPEAQGALVSVNPLDGAVAAMVGGFDFFHNGFNRVTQARRQPGSGFKPFLYSGALENGFTPSSVILDMPVVLEGGGEEDWRPENSSGDFTGPMRLREALVRSRNLVSVRILQEMGLDAAIDHASKFGFEKEAFPRNLTMALGSMTVTPLQMATAFSTFANGGFKVEPYYIERIEDASGKVLFEAEPVLACPDCEERRALPAQPAQVQTSQGPETDAEPAADGAPAYPLEPAPPAFHDAEAPEALRKLASTQGGAGYLSKQQLAPRVISPQNAWLMTDIMKGVITRGTAMRARALGRSDLAGKTGTSNDARDSWFNGFDARLVATVWVGFDEERSLGEAEDGARIAVPIWMTYMREALRNVPLASMERPPGLIDLRISPFTGAPADPLDPNAITETYMLEHQPRLAQPGDPGYVPHDTGTEGGAEPLF